MKKNMALKEVAQLLGVQPYRVQYAIAHGAVPEPKERMSGRRIYDPQTVRRWPRTSTFNYRNRRSKMSTDSAFFTISNTVTPRTIEVFLMHCIRCPEVLVQARGHLEPEHFNRPGESIYRNVLSAAYEYYETHHEAPPRGVFSARIHSDVEDIPLTLPGVRGVCHQNADDLLGFIFDETQNPQSSLRPADAIAALRMILIDRTVGNAVRSLTMQSPERFDVSLLAGQIEELHAELQQIDTTFQARPVPVLGERLADYYQQLERRRGRQLLGMRTGLQQLDDHLCGIHDFLLLSAAPGVGKSVMALQMAVGVCRHSVENNNCGCELYLSMDMASTDMIDRLHCYLGGFDWKTWRLGSQDLRNQASGPRLTARTQRVPRMHARRSPTGNWTPVWRLSVAITPEASRPNRSRRWHGD